MPAIRPLAATGFARALYPDGGGGDVSGLIAPPYDVLDETSKRALLARDEHNIVAIDLPFTPPKVIGPDAVYEQAGRRFREWLDQGVLVRRSEPALYVYQQTYTHQGRRFERRGLIAGVRLQEFGPAPDGRGGVWAHERTISAGKEDRLKLMQACRAQLSPVFGIYDDPAGRTTGLLETLCGERPPLCRGVTAGDQVLHSLWEIRDPRKLAELIEPLAGADVYIADGHHRYHTALNYRQQLAAARGGRLEASHPARWCMFVLVAAQDPGMIVLPTHRVLGGMSGFAWEQFAATARGMLTLRPFAGDLAALEAALPAAGPHAMGLYDPRHARQPMWIATPAEADPLAATHPDACDAWRGLGVAIVQHLLVERICQPAFCASGRSVIWKFPHTLDQLQANAKLDDYQLGVVMQATPLAAVMAVSRSGQLMPPKSTFFYPKLATGLVINPLEQADESATDEHRWIRTQKNP